MPCNERGNSLQAEGVGMLSVTVFFVLITEYTQKELLSVMFVSDNQELINRCNAHLQYIIPYPNETIKLEEVHHNTRNPEADTDITYIYI